jgi:hypothetical protein
MPPLAEARRTERFAEYVRVLGQAGHVPGTAHPLSLITW